MCCKQVLMPLLLRNFIYIENDVLFSNDTGILGKRNSEFSQQESNLYIYIHIYCFQIMFEDVIGKWLGSDTAIGSVKFTKNSNCSFMPDSARPVYVGGRQTRRFSDVLEKS